jgi:hypothetical protein
VISLGVSAVVAAGALATGAFVVGTHNPAVTVASGAASAGYDQATVFVDGYAYAIPMDVEWFGTDGNLRPGGQPACLAWTGSARTVPIEFGWVPITSPDGSGWRQVVWVSCK